MYVIIEKPLLDRSLAVKWDGFGVLEISTKMLSKSTDEALYICCKFVLLAGGQGLTIEKVIDGQTGWMN